METTRFIAEAFGLYFFIAGLAMIINNRRYMSIFTEVEASPALVIISGVFALIIGIVIVLSHNVWVWDWPVMVTLAGWLAFLKGAALLLMPQRFLSWFSPLYTPECIRLMGYSVLVLGLVFGFLGLVGE